MSGEKEEEERAEERTGPPTRDRSKSPAVSATDPLTGSPTTGVAAYSNPDEIRGDGFVSPTVRTVWILSAAGRGREPSPPAAVVGRPARGGDLLLRGCTAVTIPWWGGGGGGLAPKVSPGMPFDSLSLAGPLGIFAIAPETATVPDRTGSIVYPGAEERKTNRG